MLRDRVPRQPFAAPVDQSVGPGGHVRGPALVGRGPADLRNPTIELVTHSWCVSSETRTSGVSHRVGETLPSTCRNG
jgi:hypothetical protein